MLGVLGTPLGLGQGTFEVRITYLRKGLATRWDASSRFVLCPQRNDWMIFDPGVVAEAFTRMDGSSFGAVVSKGLF